MRIKSADEKGLSDSEIENYQYVKDIETQNNLGVSETSGQYNFSSFVLLWRLDLHDNKIDLEIKGRRTGRSYAKGLLDKNNNNVRFSFSNGTWESMSFFAIDVSADFSRNELIFDGSERTRNMGRWSRLEYERVVVTTW
jgi:hypothetical protein